MRPPDGEREPGPSATRLSRLVAAVTASGWTPAQGPAQVPAPPGSAAGAAPWRTALIGASPSALLWLLAAGLAVVLVTGFVLQHRGGSPAPAATPYAGTSRGGTVATAPPAASIVVDVGGRVRHPGLVKLPFGARVADAIAAAGGPLRRRDLASINLAGRVADGQFLVVGEPAGAGGLGGGGGGVGAAGSGGLVSLNSATVDQLDALPGVGPVLAQRIVDWREAHGGFASVDQLQQVSGIGARKYDDLKALVSP